MKPLLLTISFVTVTLFTMAQDQQGVVARNALNTFKQLQSVQPNKDAAMRDTALWVLGSPVKTAIIPLDKLKEYKTGQAANELIMDIDKLIYPVINSRTKQVISSITIEKNKEKWVASSFGRETNVVQKIDSIGGGDKDYKLVRILAFNLNFLSYQEGNITQFIPLQDDRERDIVQGRPVVAEKILERYVKPAIEYNGLPW